MNNTEILRYIDGFKDGYNRGLQDAKDVLDTLLEGNNEI